MPPRLGSTLLLTMLLAPHLAFGDRGGRDDAFVPDPRPGRLGEIQEPQVWKEGRVELPAWPRDSDLIEFRPELPSTPFRFYLDGRSLSRDPKDAVVRYTLVVDSPSGSRNVSFEGIRCTLRGAYRIYAYGADERFHSSGPSDWQPLPADGPEAYRMDLWRNRFCVPRETRPRTLTEIHRALRDQGTSKETTGFQAD